MVFGFRKRQTVRSKTITLPGQHNVAYAMSRFPPLRRGSVVICLLLPPAPPPHPPLLLSSPLLSPPLLPPPSFPPPPPPSGGPPSPGLPPLLGFRGGPSGGGRELSVFGYNASPEVFRSISCFFESVARRRMELPQAVGQGCLVMYCDARSIRRVFHVASWRLLGVS